MENENKNSILFGGSAGAHSARSKTTSGKGKKKKGRKRGKKALIILACVAVVLVAGYLTAVYSQIPFIKNLRDMYIETAMSTMNHQWLATAFIPESVVNEVMDNYRQSLEENMVDQSAIPEQPTVPDPPEIPDPPVTPDEPEVPEEPELPPEPVDPTGIEALLAQFPEIDPATIPADIEDFHGLQISDIEDLGIMTTAGDPLWAIDSPNNLLIVSLSGSTYKGKLAILKDPSQLIIGPNTNTGRGTTVTDLVEQYGAVLGINAGGFVDPDGHGSGRDGVGLIISRGELLQGATGSPYQICGMDYDDNLRLGTKVDTDTLRDAVQFYPIIVLNGEKMNTTSFSSNQPRTCIGQASDKTMLLLIIDGRQIGYSVGASVNTCADILIRYNCFNAMNMDGGSSSSMTYMGKMITRTSSPKSDGRYMPNAWLVMPPSEQTGTEDQTETPEDSAD